jgi:hypothetical protein
MIRCDLALDLADPEVVGDLMEDNPFHLPANAL